MKKRNMILATVCMAMMLTACQASGNSGIENGNDPVETSSAATEEGSVETAQQTEEKKESADESAQQTEETKESADNAAKLSGGEDEPEVVVNTPENEDVSIEVESPEKESSDDSSGVYVRTYTDDSSGVYVRTYTDDISGVYVRTYTDEIGGEEIECEDSYTLNADHTGELSVQDVISLTWDDHMIYVNDQSYEFKVEGNVLKVKGDDGWLEYTKKS